MGYPASNISHSTIRRGTATNNKRASNRFTSPALVYDYALRCAFIVWFEQKKMKGRKRHSFYMALVEAGRKDRLQPEVIGSLSHKLEAIYAERDISRPEYLNTTFRAVCKSFKDKLNESRCKSISDLADMLMDTCDIKEFHAVIVDIIVQTVQEETPHVVTQDLLEKLTVKTTQNKRTSAVDMRSIESFPMVNHVKELFRVQEKEHQNKLNELALICTKTALLRDLKQAIHSIHINQSWVKKDDFETAGAYEQWQKMEIKQLAERMNTIIQMYPDISLGSLQPGNEGISNFHDDHFTFIPKYPKDYFRYLMNVCIDYNRTYNIRPSHLLSEESEDLLKECWKTWRLSWPFRAAIYLNSVKAMLPNHDIGIDQVKESIKTLERVVKDYSIELWATSDSSFVKRVLIGLNNALMHELANELIEYWNISHILVDDMINLLDRVAAINASIGNDYNQSNDTLQLEQTIKGAAIERWVYIEKSAKRPDNDLQTLVSMTRMLNEEFTSLIDKRIDHIKVIDSPPFLSIVMEGQLPYFALEMENWLNSPCSRNSSLEDVLELYREILKLNNMCSAYSLRDRIIKVESWFLCHVKRWLNSIKESSVHWVERATSIDFAMDDLFSIFHNAIKFINDLQWPDHLQYCMFITCLSKINSEAICNYCKMIEIQMKSTLTIEETEQLAISETSIFGMAKHHLLGDKTPPRDPLHVHSELCVKLNQIETARKRLDELYQSMDGGKLAQYMRATMSEEHHISQTSQYSIKVIRAENLQPMHRNGLSNPYVTLEIDNQCMLKTNTINNSLNPWWDQEFTMTTKNGVDVLAIVHSEGILAADDECGSVWFKLSQELFGDFQVHELNLSLSPQGQLMLRVSMDGEKNDIQFWFGKSFRALKQSGNDIAEYMVNQMTPYIQQHLSRQVLNTLLKKEKSIFLALSRAPLKNTMGPTIHECENAIVPLISYLESNLKIFFDNLSESNMQSVALKLWKQILSCLESVLLPPLSEQMSDMLPLDVYELNVVFKWLELLKVLFNGGEDGDGIALESLECQEYYALLSLNTFYQLSTEHLIQLCQAAKRASDIVTMETNKSSSRSKSIYRSKSTIDNTTRHDMINLDVLSMEAVLRLLRMRHQKPAIEYLHEEFEKRNDSGYHNDRVVVL